MDDLARWLGAQPDEDERIARGADPGPWKSESLGRHDQAAINLAAPTSLIQFDGSRAAANGMHVSRHDPARVLREIDAKRRIIAAYIPPGASPHPGQPCVNYEGQDPADYSGHDSCSRHVEASKTALHHDYVLRLLALPYADREGYRAEWAPTE